MALATFLARRLLLAIVVLTVVSLGTFIFFATRFGSPETGPSKALAADPAKAASLWASWINRIGRGERWVGGDDAIANHTWHSLGHTAALLGLTALFVVTFSITIGVASAVRSGSAVDGLLRLLTYSAWAVPAFVLALASQSVLGWADSRLGYRPFALEGWPGECVVDNVFIQGCNPNAGTGARYAVAFVRHLTVPALSLAVAFIGLHARYVRSSLLVALNAPYTMTARAKGLPERAVILRHALRTSLATFVSALLLDFGAIFGAAMAVDWVFRLDGLGTLFLTEIATSVINVYAVVLLLTVTAGLVIFMSLLSELAVASLDPRTKLQ